MRILLPMYLLSPWSREFALRLADLGHEVHIFDFSLPHKRFAGYVPEDFLKIDLDRFKSRFYIHQARMAINSKLRYLSFWRSFSSLCREYRIDIILVLSCGGYAALTYLSGYRPYVVYTTGSDILLANRIVKAINRRILQCASAVFANGAFLRDKTCDYAQRDDVQELYLGVDTAKFVPNFHQNENNTLICTRGFMPVYNNEYLVHALAHLTKSVGCHKIIFTSNGPTLESVKKLCTQTLPSFWQDKIHFCGGLSTDALLAQLKKANIFVSMARSDGTSISLLEAMSCGLFPVVSDIPQNREWVDPQLKNGILVPLDQPETLADALATAIGDTQLRKRASEINRSLIIERADGRKNVRRLAQKLEVIVEKSAKS
jgi:glycosyltransferase involved in cell wall biosynthesis